MQDWKLTLDIPYTENIEPGFQHACLLRQKRLDGAKLSKDLYFEPITGTLMLKPLAWGPDLWNKQTNYDAHRIPLEDLDYQAGYWEEQTMTGFGGRTETRLLEKASHDTLIETLALAAIVATTLEDGPELIPILSTKANLEINQGFMVKAWGLTQFMSDSGRHYFAARFGNGKYIFALNFDATAELYHWEDGDWARVHLVDALPANARAAMGSGAGYPFAQASNLANVVAVYILPFGRGNILLSVSTPGHVSKSVYHVPDCEWDTGGERFLITEAGPLQVFVPKAEQRRHEWDIHKIGFPTSATWEAGKVALPYIPTTEMNGTVAWTKTMGAPTLGIEWQDGNGNAWANSSALVQLKLTLTGDGTCTPFVDAYQFYFPNVTREFNPTSWDLPNSAIESISLSDGPKPDDQQISIVVLSDGTDQSLRNLVMRHETRAKLTIDGTEHSQWLFQAPRTIAHRPKAQIHLEGHNLGTKLLTEKRFLWPPVFDSFTHPEAVVRALELCGWTSADIVATQENVRLPGLETSGTDPSRQFLMQPAFNTQVWDFLSNVIDNYSGWPLEFRGDGKWYYQPREFPTSADVTFYMTRSALRPWYESDLEFEPEPPEANYVIMVGRQDDGRYIANYALDWGSVSGVDNPLPPGLADYLPPIPATNYIGRIKPVIYVDLSLNTMDMLNAVLRRVFDRAKAAVGRYIWRGPFVPSLRVGDGVNLEGIGLLQLESYDMSAVDPRECTGLACTRYVGITYFDSEATGG